MGRYRAGHNTRQRNMGVGGGTRGATVGPRGDLEPKRPAKIRVSAPVDPSKGDSSSWDRAGSPILRKAGGCYPAADVADLCLSANATYHASRLCQAQVYSHARR